MYVRVQVLESKGRLRYRHHTHITPTTKSPRTEHRERGKKERSYEHLARTGSPGGRATGRAARRFPWPARRGRGRPVVVVVLFGLVVWGV